MLRSQSIWTLGNWNLKRLNLGIWTSLLLGGLVTSAQAVEFSDGTRHFAGVPRLIKTRATNTDARTWGGRYDFTISVPPNASEPLGKLELHRHQGGDRFDRFETERTRAFVDGDRNSQIAVESQEIDRDRQTVSVTFNPPIQPGQTVTLSLTPIRNPAAGIYLWGVTAFPAGEKVASQFLGYGRLHFYRSNDHFFKPY